MENNKLEPCFMRLIQSLKMNQVKKSGITVFIGAGCSLASSEKNITTYGIVKSLVEQYSLTREIPDDWRVLYERFVNIVWNGQGTRNRIHLLEDFFQGMHPSIGYESLRWLIENQYVNNLITTNFDPMLDCVLEGLSYRLIVGGHTEIIGEKPLFTLIKAHGDLQYGYLRFAPAELAHLPDDLHREINEITKGIVIMVGFRGQDMGVLNALYCSNEYNAYWIALDKPDHLNAYENEQIYAWMNKRNSESNFLYGEEWGDFDHLFQKIKETLILLKKDSSKTPLSKSWEKSTLYDYFLLNKRFLSLFETIYLFLEQETDGKLWKVTAPYYAPSFDKLIRTTIELLNKNVIPLLYSWVGNEVDALVFSISCSIWLACQGYPYTPTELLNLLCKRSISEIDTKISQEFWTATSLLSDNDIPVIKRFFPANAPISFCFDPDKELTVVLQRINLYELSLLLDILKVLLLFTQTSGSEGRTFYGLQQKKNLENYLYEIQSIDQNILLKMSPMPYNIYQELFETILKPYFTQEKIGERYTLYHYPVYVDFTVKSAQLGPQIKIWDVLLQEAEQHRESFMKGFDSTRFVARQFQHVFAEFLASQSNGFFVIGESGSGKTVSLKQWLSSLAAETYVCYPISGREQCGIETLGEGLFGDRFLDPNKIGHLQIMLEQRRQVLILILDAINEIQGKFSETAAHYTALLNFSNMLVTKQTLNIKLVITCRSDFYHQLRKNCGLIPSDSSFFSTVLDNEVSTVYTVPYFNDDDVDAFMRLYRREGDLMTLEKMQKEFGALIYLPMNLHVICDTYQGTDDKKVISTKEAIFEKWYAKLVSVANLEGISTEDIQAVIDFTIRYIYFEDHDEGLKTHFLASALTERCPGAFAVYEWLTVHRIFEKNTYTPNQIQFSHDSLEEFFLSNYIIRHYSDRLYAIGELMIGVGTNQVVIDNAIQTVFYKTFISDKLLFLNAIVKITAQMEPHLLHSAVKTCFTIIGQDSEQGYTFLKTTEQYLLQRDFISLLEVILSTINQELETNRSFNLLIIQVITRIIRTTNCHYNNNLLAAGLFLYSKGQFLLPTDENENKYKEALQTCNQAEKALADDSPDNLIDAIDALKAVLLQTLGLLNEAIQLMESCYNRQKSKGAYDEACQSALNLGAMYREMTQFDHAIKLYNSICTDYITDQTKVHRLYMNLGIIYKNKVQNAIFSRKFNTEETIGFYNIALDNFKRTYTFAEEKDDVPLRLEIYAELVECKCAAYHLNLASIDEAVYWVRKMDEIIRRYPIPIERIQHLRMWARVLTLQCEFTKALQCLEQGFEIASAYNIPFRATDCCNLITGIISDNLNNQSFMNDEILEMGLRYGEYAIKYYQQLKTPSHRYLQDSIIKYDKIKAEWDKRHPSS